MSLAPVTVYTRTVCPICDRVKLKLRQAGVEYDTVNLDLPEHDDARTYVTEVLGARSVPVVVADGWTIFGYEPTLLKKLIESLTKNGEQ